jgi:chitodextrinase
MTTNDAEKNTRIPAWVWIVIVILIVALIGMAFLLLRNDGPVGQPLIPTSTPEFSVGLPVMAVINAPTQGQVNQPITFDGSTSTANAGIASYTWSFSDGSTANGAVIQHSFVAPGSYDVVLTITDVDGNIADASIVIAIQ